MIEPTVLLFLIAVGVVLVTSLLKFPWLSDKAKVALATATSILGAAAHVWFTGDFEAMELIPTSLQVLGASQLLYKFLLDHSKLDDALERVGVKKNYDDEV